MPGGERPNVRAGGSAENGTFLQPGLCSSYALTPRYDYPLQTIKELPWDKWRVWDPDDSLRFYAVRLHEAGMIKSSPQKIMSQGADWRFLNEKKKELKG